MGGIENIDKYTKIGGGFAKKMIFKRWFKTGLMGLFDFKLVNGLVAWNTAASLPPECCKYR